MIWIAAFIASCAGVWLTIRYFNKRDERLHQRINEYWEDNH